MKLSFIFKILPQKIAYAHCDIPCGIYDPHEAQLAAHTIIRMTQMLDEIKGSDKKAIHDISRMVHVKEEHGHIVEDELGTLGNDYFKEEHYSKFSNLKALLGKGVSLSVKTRQSIDLDLGKELLETVMQIAEIFYKTKGLESARVKAPYPTGLDIVVQK